MKTKLMLAAAIAVLVTPALADEFYIVHSPNTRECHIVAQKPEPSVGVVVGTPFGARIEAEQHMKTIKECHETTGAGSSTTIIKK
jgi:hypothetical protein